MTIKTKKQLGYCCEAEMHMATNLFAKLFDHVDSNWNDYFGYKKLPNNGICDHPLRNRIKLKVWYYSLIIFPYDIVLKNIQSWILVGSTPTLLLHCPLQQVKKAQKIYKAPHEDVLWTVLGKLIKNVIHYY